MFLVYDRRGAESFSVRLEGAAFEIAQAFEDEGLTRKELGVSIDLDSEAYKKALNNLLRFGFILELDQRLIWLPVPEKKQFWQALDRRQ